MAALRPSGTFVVLLLSVVLVWGVRLVLTAAHREVMGLAEYAMLITVAASALLTLPQTVIVGAVNLAAAVGVYGILMQDIGHASQITVITAMAAALGIGVVVCHLRISGQRRFGRLMIARERLAVIREAGSRVGTTLNVARTAEELAEVAVHRFADHAAVDLFETVLRGEEPDADAHAGPVTLRRTALLPGPALPSEAVGPGVDVTYRAGSAQALSLTTGTPACVESTGSAGSTDWPVDPDGADAEAPYSALAIPLRARGVTLGIALLTRSRERAPFDAADVLLAEEIGARAAVCMDNARRYTRERQTSLALQRSLLPSAVPKQPAVEAATRYLPADTRAGVGGDWFDVIPLSGARAALVVGDVVGHGIHASATMGRLRAAVRTLADIDLPPGELLTRLDDVVLRLQAETRDAQDAHHEGAVGINVVAASCLYMIYDPVTRTCTAASAGHPPPAVISPGSEAEYLDIPVGPPLGVGGLPFESTELDLTAGSVLVMYTDGLIEHPGVSLDDGLTRLKKVLSEPVASLEDRCDYVLDTLVDEHPRDDIALLVARTKELDVSNAATWDLPGDLAGVSHARDLAASRLTDWDLEELAFTTEVIVSELVTNAIRYGGGPVQLRLIRNDTLICEVSDGSSTEPHLRRARTFDEGGRGLFIVAQLAERWGTRQRADGKIIWAEIPLPAQHREE
ncbi:SpoIIE family protein phosphatase [Streptomyces sp. NPDC093970]|uniref:ATP-binding SpoIIE family protein phosphatase n=1 Tax=Streptomyces sp. NPDC093970 TaxID=3155076 RepID=UPI0034348AB9